MIPGNKNSKTEEQQNEPEPAGADPERSATPASYRYNTPNSMDERANPGEESEPEEWYPADVQQEDFEEQNAPEKQDSPEEQENEPENLEASDTIVETKSKKRQSKKGKEPQEPTRSSSRVNKEQHNERFAKEHFITYMSFVAAQIAKQFIPQSLKQAIEGPEKDMWLEACRKQLAKIEKKKSWELCDLPEGYKALPTKWVFDPKKRARLVVCGNFEKKTDVETFAAVVNMIMVKLFFLVVAIKDWECLQFDFEAAFLNGEMKTRSVYVRQLPGFDDGTKRVYKLLKTLYGLKDSPLVWFREVTDLMKREGFELLSSEACVFINRDTDVWIMLYVDDMAIAAATKEQIDKVAKQLGETFSLTALGEVEQFLGLQIVRDRKLRIIQISQELYIERVLTGKGWLNLNGVGSPLDIHMKYDPELPELEDNKKNVSGGFAPGVIS